MIAEHVSISTNVHIFRAIADDAYKKMSEDMKGSVRLGPEGNRIIDFDPERKSFKQAMISIVFTCIWLEAILHLLIVKKCGKKKFTKNDKSSYKHKLDLLDCKDDELLQNVERLRQARKGIVHEKAYCEFDNTGKFTGKLWRAQDEAENARVVMLSVEKWSGFAD